MWRECETKLRKMIPYFKSSQRFWWREWWCLALSSCIWSAVKRKWRTLYKYCAYNNSFYLKNAFLSFISANSGQSHINSVLTLSFNWFTSCTWSRLWYRIIIKTIRRFLIMVSITDFGRELRLDVQNLLLIKQMLFYSEKRNAAYITLNNGMKITGKEIPSFPWKPRRV